MQEKDGLRRSCLVWRRSGNRNTAEQIGAIGAVENGIARVMWSRQDGTERTSHVRLSALEHVPNTFCPNDHEWPATGQHRG